MPSPPYSMGSLIRDTERLMDHFALSGAAVLGLSICYDIRFPALFEALGRLACDVIAIPAAFTVPTGKAHWHLLQRARAVEASAYVVAAAQVGRHEDGRSTFGHSLVVDPWGEVLLDMGGVAAGLAFAEIDPALVRLCEGLDGVARAVAASMSSSCSEVVIFPAAS